MDLLSVLMASPDITITMCWNVAVDTYHPVGPLSSGHIGHPQVDQSSSPEAAAVLRQVQQVKVEREVAFFHQRRAVVHHGLLHLVVIVRLCHHQPGAEPQVVGFVRTG